jgi:glycosyltransferase involved in cell wall biosynthesis
MRIAVCSSQVPFEYGGAEILAEALVAELKRRGHEVELVQLPQQWYPKEEILKNYLMWRLTSLDQTFDQQPIHRVIALKYPAYAIQHAHKTTWLIHQLRQAYELYGTPYGFFDNSEEDHALRRLTQRMDCVTIGESRHVYAISKNVAGRLQRYNGIDAGVIYPPPALDGQLRSESYGDYVLSVSRLAPIKRVGLLVQAMAHVSTPIRCRIVGRGQELDPLQQQARRLGIQERVEFLGFVPNEGIVALYANALAVYYAPVDEDYGFATVEAFKCEKPVLTVSDSGGVLEFVEDSVTGCVTPPEDPQALAQRLDELYAHRDLARRLGRAGAALVTDITWDRAVPRLLED